MAKHCTYEHHQVNRQEIYNREKNWPIVFQGGIFFFNTISHSTSTVDIFSIHFSHIMKACIVFPKLWSSNVCKTKPNKFTLLHILTRSYDFKPLYTAGVILMCMCRSARYFLFLIQKNLHQVQRDSFPLLQVEKLLQQYYCKLLACNLKLSWVSFKLCSFVKKINFLQFCLPQRRSFTFFSPILSPGEDMCTPPQGCTLWLFLILEFQIVLQHCIL